MSGAVVFTVARLRDAAYLLGMLVLLTTFSASAADAHSGHSAVAPARPEASAQMPWSDYPLIVPAGGRPERGRYSLIGSAIAGEKLSVFAPGKPDSPKTLEATGGRWLVTAEDPGAGGHHWLMASAEQNGKIITASTIVTFPSKGDAPTRLLNQSRGGLEIVPLVVPEHGGVREGETWKFRVRFEHQPLPDAVVHIETENGTRSQSVSDKSGGVKIAFPRDFDPSKIDPKAGATRTRKGFVLAVEHQAAGVTHLTAYNYFYYPDLMRERNLMAGFAFLALGMVLASPLLRRKEEPHA